MILEEQIIIQISKEDRHYEGDDNYWKRMIRENSVTGLEQLQRSTEEKSYIIVNKQIQLLINHDNCVEREI